MRSLENSNEAFQYLEERFGVKQADLDSFQLVENSGDIWLVSSGLDDFKDLEMETVGIRFLRKTGRGFKPTTYALQMLENKITENIVEVDKDEMTKLLARDGMIPGDLENDGYVAIEHQSDIIGCGFYKESVVSSRIPKGRSKELLQIIKKD